MTQDDAPSVVSSPLPLGEAPNLSPLPLGEGQGEGVPPPLAPSPRPRVAPSPAPAAPQFRDLREFLQHLARLGELKTIRGAHWDLEIGGITEIAHHRRNGPAVLFDRIPDYPPGHRVLVNGMGSSARTALILGLPTDKTYRELLPLWKQRANHLQLIPPETVQNGPILENARTGAAVDLFAFPAPRWHEHDGGRYIGTGSFVATRDPDAGWVNLGCYRVMIKSPNQVFFFMSPGKHGLLMRQKYLARGQRMPVLMSFGHDPTLMLAASVEVPTGVCEYDYAGGIKGAPIQVIPGPVTGLPMPAHAEIVIEGFVEPGRVDQEGPFGEWTGYYASGHNAEPVVDVHAVYWRNEPIILGAPPGKPPTELTSYRSLMRSALLWEQVERMGVPDVAGVWCHEAGGTRMFVAASVKQRYPGHARQVGHAVASTRSGHYANRYVVVVDDDVDVTDLDDVLWAMCMHSDPAESIDLVRAAASGPLDPRVSPDKRARGDYTTGKLIIDATRPFEWRDQFPHPVGLTPEARRTLEARWLDFLLTPGSAIMDTDGVDPDAAPTAAAPTDSLAATPAASAPSFPLPLGEGQGEGVSSGEGVPPDEAIAPSEGVPPAKAIAPSEAIPPGTSVPRAEGVPGGAVHRTRPAQPQVLSAGACPPPIPAKLPTLAHPEPVESPAPSRPAHPEPVESSAPSRPAHPEPVESSAPSRPAHPEPVEGWARSSSPSEQPSLAASPRRPIAVSGTPSVAAPKRRSTT